MSGVAWSDQEIETLRTLYPVERWPALLKVLPSRSKAACRCKVISLGIKRLRNCRTAWTGAERGLLTKLYPNTPWPAICAAIPRHPQSAISKQANMMKLRRDGSTKQSRFALIRTLRRLRRESGVQQRHLAERIGVASVQLANWERGQQLPRVRGLFDWVEALGCRLEIVRSNGRAAP